ncbi:MAG TPA: hypothetical protein VFZ78_02715 [Flavisolibacter sp.]
MNAHQNRSIAIPLFYDGRFLVVFTGMVLIFSGVFVIIQSFTGHFLPHDTVYLGMDAERLSLYYGGRITRFMFHDRVAFGGSLMAVGILYMWLAEFPLRQGQAWAWWILLISGIIGFGSFLTYLGYGYLDEWHGVATLLLLPFFAVGMIRSWRLLEGGSLGDLLKMVNRPGFHNSHQFGILLLLFTGAGMFAAGMTIMIVGMTSILVPQDMEFIGIASCSTLNGVSEKLLPLIAHDRACFGGGVATIGLMIFFIVRRAEETRSMWETIFLTVNTGFAAAIGIHFYIGYTIPIHIAPAIMGYLIALAGLACTYRRFMTTNGTTMQESPHL